MYFNWLLRIEQFVQALSSNRRNTLLFLLSCRYYITFFGEALLRYLPRDDSSMDVSIQLGPACVLVKQNT